MARVTSEGSGDDEVTRLDFKEDSPASEAIKDVRESLPVDISEATKESVQSLLSTLGYELFRDFKKDRTTYVFKTFHIDIDEYTVPEKATVFEVEGQPAAVEAEYAVLQEHQLLSSQDTSE
jgi:adenylate cyclase class IV